MNSALYTGMVSHRRHGPTRHGFSYPMFMMYLDLAELDEVFAKRWFWSATRPALARFSREDHLGDPDTPLETAVRDLVAARCGTRPRGPIRILTQLRHFGYCFNPVSFYYCFDAADQALEFVVLEVNNTPWGEQHCYVLRNTGGQHWMHAQFEKAMHVSPFMDMEMQYVCLFAPPGQRLEVTMQNLAGGKAIFDARLAMERREITGWTLAATLVRFPIMAQQTIFRIYWQALRLWLKRTPYHPKPSKGNAT